MSYVHRLNTFEQLDRVCEEVARLSPCHLPLFQAAASGTICLVQIENRSTKWPRTYLHRYENRPTCVVISDDRGYGFPSYPPEQWASAKRIKYWCAAAMVHGSGGELAHYKQAALSTLAAKRFALIETTSEHAMAWAKFLAPTRTLVILPDSGVHPVCPVMH